MHARPSPCSRARLRPGRRDSSRRPPSVSDGASGGDQPIPGRRPRSRPTSSRCRRPSAAVGRRPSWRSDAAPILAKVGIPFSGRRARRGPWTMRERGAGRVDGMRGTALGRPDKNRRRHACGGATIQAGSSCFLGSHPWSSSPLGFTTPCSASRETTSVRPTFLIHGNYCGRATTPPLAPVDALDAACARHDACTPDGGLPSKACNLRLQAEAERIANDPAVGRTSDGGGCRRLRRRDVALGRAGAEHRRSVTGGGVD